MQSILPSTMLPTTPVQSLHDRLLNAEERALSLIAQDVSAIGDFQEDWSRLGTEVAEAIERQSIDEETISMAHRVAARVQILANRFISFYDDIDTIASSFQQELDSMFSGLAIMDTPTSSSSLTTRKSTLPVYIESAHNWLMKNLHNPYPTKQTRLLLSQKSGATCKDVDTWFARVRKRIGWNDLRLEEFSNKRSLIVAAAMDFFKSPNTQAMDRRITDYRPGSSAPVKDFSNQFITIYQRASNLYPRGLSDVSEARPLVKYNAKEFEGERGFKWLESATSDSLFYPTPEPSQASSPEPSSPQISYKAINPRKRKNPYSTTLDNDDTAISQQESVSKRARLQRLTTDPAMTIPSPPATEPDSLPDHLSTPSLDLQGSTIPDSAAPLLSGKRKRRLSDTGCYPLPKRPHHILGLPQGHSVSNPLPLKPLPLEDISLNTDGFAHIDGHNFSFKTPPPVSTCGFDELEEINIDCFLWDPEPSAPTSLAPTFELPLNTVDNTLSDSVALPNFDLPNFCRYDAPSQTSQPDATPTDFGDHTISLTNSIDDMISFLEPYHDLLSSSESMINSHTAPRHDGLSVGYLECFAF